MDHMDLVIILRPCSLQIGMLPIPFDHGRLKIGLLTSMLGRRGFTLRQPSRFCIYLGECNAMMAAAFVALSESIGTFLAVARYGSATPVPPSVLSRGAGWLGFGTLLAGLFGCVTGPCASVESAGLLALTRVGSRRVIQISAAFMIFFSLFGSAGLGFLQFCNLNSFRTKFIEYLIKSVPEYFRECLMSWSTSDFRMV